jgi:hypothetical protein
MQTVLELQTRRELRKMRLVLLVLVNWLLVMVPLL